MAAKKRILIVEDDSELLESLEDQFGLQDEFETTGAGDGKSALELVKSGTFDLVLLDVGLPDLDGRDVCRLIRRAGTSVPIIMLTAADSDADTILGLDSGANDYVTKPFVFSVLLARIRAHLRQYEQSEDATFTIGPYTFKPSAKHLVDEDSGQKIRLTEKETSILKYLYRAGDHAVSRGELLNDVWGYNAGVTTHTLETHVYRLRQKIEANPSEARILVTEPGGYRLNVHT